MLSSEPAANISSTTSSSRVVMPINPLPPRSLGAVSLGTDSLDVTVSRQKIRTSSSATRSASLKSPSAPGSISVRRASPYFSTSSFRLSRIRARIFLGCASRSSRLAMIPASSGTHPRSSGVPAQPAGAAAYRGWPAPGSSVSLKRFIRRSGRRRHRGLWRMVSMTASRLSSAISNPSRMCARRRARSSSNCVRRFITSQRWSIAVLQRRA